MPVSGNLLHAWIYMLGFTCLTPLWQKAVGIEGLSKGLLPETDIGFGQVSSNF